MQRALRVWVRKSTLRSIALLAIAGILVAACSSTKNATTKPSASTTSSHVLLVGTYNGKRGGYSTIQAGVDAAHPGDWILVGPGDYHETADQQSTPSTVDQSQGGVGGVFITTPDIHLRGMNRNTVIVDGDKTGAPMACDPDQAWQNFGISANGTPYGGSATTSVNKPYGRNGIVVFKANGVAIDNLTACNFLSGSGSSGNEIWWDGGAGTGKIGLNGYSGSYLTATTTYFSGEKTAAAYGIFSSNAAGPGSWNQLYANNFNDSGMYVGACLQVCDVTIDNAWMENNSLGYSGTDSGGTVVIENSQFDNNEDGVDTNTQIGGDPPAPQNGACPANGVSPITHTHSCWVFIHNFVHNNNNAGTPVAGSAAAGPYGTGMTVSGGRNDTVMDNRFVDNGAWGILFVPYPDSSKPVDGQTCSGTGGVQNAALGCIYDPEGDALLNNTFVHDGYFGNPSNSDFGQIAFSPGQPQNCFAGNTDPQGSAPADLETIQPTCGTITKKANTGGPLLAQVLCDTGFGTCPAGAHYPTASKVVLKPLPSALPTMPNPCLGVPTNAWCPAGSTTSAVHGPGIHTRGELLVDTYSTGAAVLERRVRAIAD